MDGEVTITIKGADAKAIPLLSVAEAFKEFHQIVDKSYCTFYRKNKIQKNDRDLYGIATRNIRNGSIIAELYIVVPLLAQGAFYFHSTGLLTPDSLWGLAKNTVKFLMAYVRAKHEGKKIIIHQHDNPCGFNVVAQEGANVKINVGTLVQSNVLRAEPNIKNLAKLMDEKNISSFSALDRDDDGIILTPKENKLFNPETVIDDKPVKVTGKIFRLDVERKTGRVRILEGESQGEYLFQIVGRQSISIYIHALERESSQIAALREIVRHPTGEETLAGLQLIGINHGD